MTGQLYKSGHIGKVAMRIKFLKQIIKSICLKVEITTNLEEGVLVRGEQTWSSGLRHILRARKVTLYIALKTLSALRNLGATASCCGNPFFLAEVGKLVKFELSAKIQHRKLKFQT